MKLIKILNYLINPETISYINTNFVEEGICGRSGITIHFNSGNYIHIFDDDCGREYDMSAIDYFNKITSKTEICRKNCHDR